jgi:hypothetical protein
MRGRHKFARAAPNQIARNQTLLNQTEACITKSSSKISAPLRNYTALSGNPLWTLRDNLSVPSSRITNSEGEKRARLKLTDIAFFFGIFPSPNFFYRNTMFQKPAQFLFSCKEAPNMVETLDWALLSHRNGNLLYVPENRKWPLKN